MGRLLDTTGSYSAGLLVLATALVIEAVLVISLRLPQKVGVRAPGFGLRGSRFQVQGSGEAER
jgi:hypothetical protein